MTATTKPHHHWQWLRLILSLVLCGEVLLLVGLNWQMLQLEIMISFLPQILIFVMATSFLAFYIAGRIVTRTSGRHFILDLTDFDYALFVLVCMFAGAVAWQLAVRKPAPLATLRTSQVKLATYNKLYSNPDVRSALWLLNAQRPDVIALEEIKESEVEFIRDTLDYQYSYITDCDCSAQTTEVALLSRYPILKAKTVHEHFNGTIVESVIEMNPGQEIAVYAVHLTPPFSDDTLKQRTAAFAKLYEVVKKQNRPTFVLGDFNTSIFSPEMQQFRDLAADEVRISSGSQRPVPQCSWYGYGSIFCVRIDHIFVPTGAYVIDERVSEPLGSDHRMVIVTSTLP